MQPRLCPLSRPPVPACMCLPVRLPARSKSCFTLAFSHTIRAASFAQQGRDLLFFFPSFHRSLRPADRSPFHAFVQFPIAHFHPESRHIRPSLQTTIPDGQDAPSNDVSGVLESSLRLQWCFLLFSRNSRPTSLRDRGGSLSLFLIRVRTSTGFW